MCGGRSIALTGVSLNEVDYFFWLFGFGMEKKTQNFFFSKGLVLMT